MQCICGRWFKPTTYNPVTPQDMCPACLNSSSPQGYVASKEWVGQDVSGVVFTEHVEYAETTNE